MRSACSRAFSSHSPRWCSDSANGVQCGEQGPHHLRFRAREPGPMPAKLRRQPRPYTRRLTAIVLAIGVICVGSVMFVITDLDEPYSGFFNIPSAAMHDALADM